MVPQEFNCLQPELALCWVYNQSVPVQVLKQQTKLRQVLLQGSTGDQDVIQVHKQIRHMQQHRIIYC